MESDPWHSESSNIWNQDTDSKQVENRTDKYQKHSINDKRQNHYRVANSKREGDYSTWKRSNEKEEKHSRPRENNQISSSKPDQTTLNEIYHSEKPNHRLYVLNYRVNRCPTNCSNLECYHFHQGQAMRRVPYPVDDA